MNIEGSKTALRALEPRDVRLLYRWENDTSLWSVSGTTEPFSRDRMERFIEAQRHGDDLVRSGQLRLIIIERESHEEVGMIDLFEYDPVHRRAGIGIMIAKEFRACGYGRDAILTLCDYTRRHLNMHQLWATVMTDNTASLALFRSAGFHESGIHRDWVCTPEGFVDEVMFQKIL